MGKILRRLVFGRETNRRRRWSLFVGGYAAVVAAFFALVLVARIVGAGDLANVLYYRALPLALFYAPALVAAVAAFREGGLVLCLGIGLAPVAVVGVAFGAVDLAAWLRGTVPPGDAPAWALVLTYAVACLTSAVAGFVAGTVARLTMRAVVDGR